MWFANENVYIKKSGLILTAHLFIFLLILFIYFDFLSFYFVGCRELGKDVEISKKFPNHFPFLMLTSQKKNFMTFQSHTLFGLNFH